MMTHRGLGLAPRVGSIVLLFVAAAPETWAQAARRGDSDSLARVQAMVQQLSAERGALQAQNKQLTDKLQAAEAELATLHKERDGLSGRASRAEGEAQRAEAGQQALGAQLDKAREDREKMVTEFRAFAENTRQLELERNRLKSDLGLKTKDLDTCQSANVELATIAEDAVTRYEKKGVFTSLSQKEPFTQITRARIGNLVDSYRAEIEAKKLAPAKEVAPSGAASN